MPLTDIEVRTARLDSKTVSKKADGGGLYLVLQQKAKGTSKLWRLEYSYGGKKRTLSIGPYPRVSLRDAREARDEAKRLLANNIDPTSAKRAGREAERVATEGALQSVAERWLEKIRPKLADRTYAAREAPLKRYIFPKLGKRPISQIEPPELLDVLRSIYGSGTAKQRLYLVRRIRNDLGRIFRFGIAEGLCTRDPAADIRDALDEAPRVKHRAALSLSEMQTFFAKLDSSKADAVTKDYLLFCLYTWARPGEVRFARWSEMEALETDTPIWRIPSERKKERHEFICPLSPQALKVLKRAKKRSGDSPFVFAVATNKEGVVSMNRGVNSLRDMGFESATVHGFRSTASTAANELGWDGDVIEAQLAHAQGSIRRIYNRAKYVKARLDLVTRWGVLMDEHQIKAAIG